LHDYAWLLSWDLAVYGLQFANLTKEQPAVKDMKVCLNADLHRKYESILI